MLMGFADQGIPIREIPIETIYIDNNSGSHFHAVKDSWRIYREILKFSGSSLVSFLLDYLLYTVLTLLTGGALVVSNVLARIASAAFNYTLNRNVVFRDDGAVWKSAVRYSPIPCPSGPVVASTPGVTPNSGCPGVMLPKLLNAFKSSIEISYPDKCNTEYNKLDA